MVVATRHHRAFTLVELLVVIGIIAVLVGVLLPVLGAVQGRSRDLMCLAQLRQMGGLIASYAADNRGSMPYGLYFNHAGPDGQDPGDGEFTSLFSMLGAYAGRKLTGDNEDINFPKWLQCPTAAQVYDHVVGYACSMAMFPRLDSETSDTPKGQPILKPAVLTGLRPAAEKILIHDTSVMPGMENSVGWVVDYDLDNQRFADPATPQFRFFMASDPFAKLPPFTYANNKPITFHASWRNKDPGASDEGAQGFGWGPYQGNLRFRHERNTTCYALFADGHAGGLKGKFRSDGSWATTPPQHDALRKYFMPKWQTGVKPKQGVPGG